MFEYYDDDPLVQALQAAAPFPVELDCEGYPDVSFNIIFTMHPTREMAEKAVLTLENYMRSYNRWHFFRPIHYVSDIDEAFDEDQTFSVFVHMDCGNANPNLLVGAIKAIAETKLPIFRVILE